MGAEIVKSLGIVLGWRPFTETSRVVTVLTPDWGKINVLIKGALRPKGFSLGQYDLFYTSEFLFYVRPHDDLRLAKEVYPLKLRSRFRQDWRAMALASYLTDLVGSICPYESPQDELFHFLDGALDVLGKNGAQLSLLYWLELRLLELLGLAPQLQRCAVCKAMAIGGGKKMLVAPGLGGLVCTDCAPTAVGEILPPDVIAILRAWQRARRAKVAAITVCNQLQERKMGDFLDKFLRFQLELPLTSRRIALAMQRLEKQDG